MRAGSAASVLVAAADVRVAPPGGDLEPFLGDGAAALLVGEGDDVLARFEGAHAITQEFSDVWRMAGARFPEQGDPTFVRAYGYEKLIPEAVEGLLGGSASSARTSRAWPATRPTPASPPASCGPSSSRTRRSSAAAAPRLDRQHRHRVTAARAGGRLEEARPGDRLLVVGYGSGADALLFQATERIEGWDRRGGLLAQLRAGRPLAHYGKLLRFRRLVETEVIRAFTGLPVLQREEHQDMRLYGQKCTACGAVQYPRRHVCWKCSGTTFADYRLGRRGRVFTFTRDHLVPTPDPPTAMVAADLEGGGRFYTQMTDCDPATVAIGMPVELTFRRFHEGAELVNYFWKFRPVLGA